MATLDASIIVVGLPTVIEDLHTNLVVGVWIITIYRLMITILLVSIGRFADLYGRVRLYNMGFAVFTIGSLLCALAPTAEALLLFRLVQGVGAALLFVNSVAIVTDAFAGKSLGQGIGMNQVAINAGTIVGYTLSGLLIGTPVLGWRTIFLVNVPVGLFGTYWSKKRLREIHHSSHREKFDKLGALTFSSSLTSLLLGLTLGGLTSPLTLTLVTLSILLMALFLLLERRVQHPVIDLSLFKNRLFTTGNIANLLSGLAFAALAFTMTLYFQLVRGYDAYHAGIALIPLEVTLLLVGPVSGSLSDRWGARGLSTLGLVTSSAGFLLLANINRTTSDQQILLSLGVIGVGVGLFRSPNASSVMGSVPADQRGISSGLRATIINTSIVASIPLALALMTSDIPYDRLVGIIGQNQLSPMDASSFLAGIQHALIAFAVITLISAIFSLLRGPRTPPGTEKLAETAQIGAPDGG
ncbi:MFS transporter [Candidatus Bathyarchaeota archaeon]|nr:MAG: MFS transporter [Candidatus Bathyarchaeota archaeon]